MLSTYNLHIRINIFMKGTEISKLNWVVLEKIVCIMKIDNEIVIWNINLTIFLLLFELNLKYYYISIK